MSQPQQNPFHYVPTESIAILFVTLFGITTAVHFYQAIFYRRWFLILTIVLCGIGETVGWSGRLWGSFNPYNFTPFIIQITALIFSPSFLTAAIFNLLPEIIQPLGTRYSRLSPKFYKFVFVSVDVIALLTQAGGGAIASRPSSTNTSLGANVMLFGIILQTIAVVLFTLCVFELVIRFHLDKPLPGKQDVQGLPEYVPLSVHTAERNAPNVIPFEKSSSRWKQVGHGVVKMIIGIAVVISLVIIRGIYRTIELADGWNGTVIATQWLFEVFDGLPIVLSLLTLNVLHPGRLLGTKGSTTSKHSVAV